MKRAKTLTLAALATVAAALCSHAVHAETPPSRLLACAQSVVVAVPPASPAPTRRRADEPFFAFVDDQSATTAPSSAAAAQSAVAGLINSLASTVEAATGRLLYPVRAELVRADARRLGCAGQGQGPPVSWDPLTGLMVVRLAVGVTAETMAATVPSVGGLARETVRRLSSGAGDDALGVRRRLPPPLPDQQQQRQQQQQQQRQQQQQQQQQQSAGAQAAVAAVAAAVAASLALAMPLWECVACVAALGLLAPLAINAALGAAVEAACAALHLGPDECLDLSLGALLAGVVLSALSAAPIFAACRLAQCGRAVAARAVV